MHTTQQSAPLVAVGTARLERTAITGGGVGTIALESFLVQVGLEVQEQNFASWFLSSCPPFQLKTSVACSPPPHPHPLLHHSARTTENKPARHPSVRSQPHQEIAFLVCFDLKAAQSFSLNIYLLTFRRRFPSEATSHTAVMFGPLHPPRL